MTDQERDAGPQAPVVSHVDLPKVCRAAFGCGVVEIVFDRSAGAAFDQKLHYRHVAVLIGNVKRGNALTVCQTADGVLLIDVGAAIQQPCRSLSAVAGGGRN